MNSTALATATEFSGTLVITEDRREAADAAIEARSPNTRKMYKRHIEALIAWLGDRPLDDRHLSRWVRHLADQGGRNGQGMAPASIAQAVAAAVFFAKIVGVPDPRGSITSDVLRIIKRKHSKRGRGQAKPLTADQAAEIMGDSIRDGRLRDAVLTGLLFMAGMRVSEVAALTWGQVEAATEPELEGALFITVGKSKTNQEGEDNDVRLVKGKAASALNDMRPLVFRPEDPVFTGWTIEERNGRKVRVPGAADPRSIENWFKAAAAASKITGVSPHSGRVGLACELTQRGASMGEVMLAGNWRTSRMVAHYSKKAKVAKGGVAKYL